MQYTSVIFRCAAVEEYQQDLFIADLAELGFDSFENLPEGFAAYIPSDLYDPEALEQLIAAYADEFSCTYEADQVPEQNWNEAWEQNFQPLDIDGCYVRATFHEAKPGAAYEIIIDPKMSFGTGHHQTTSMMIRYLLELDVRDKHVLDMGAGTGILAILAARRGAASLVGIDYDDVCCESMRENADLNGVTNMEILHGSKEVIASRSFDLILANINRNILLDQIPAYAGVLAPGGTILFSGFYETPDLSMIQASCEAHGLTYLDHKKDGDWVAARFQKP